MIGERFFPVNIAEIGETLSIIDTRPTLGLLIAFSCIVVSVVGSAATFAFTYSIREVLLWLPILVTGFVTLLFSINGTLREIYVFDRSNDSYYFTRRTIWKKDIIQGSLSQFRAVQIQREYTNDSVNFRVALLMQGLLLGRSDSQLMRESLPVFNCFDTEASIAHAISSFLNIKDEGEVRV